MLSFWETRNVFSQQLKYIGMRWVVLISEGIKFLTDVIEIRFF